MEELADNLRETIKLAKAVLEMISEKEAGKKSNPAKWSKKEILGHLIDSASNNHQKFVRLATAPGKTDFVGYKQDEWVNIQHYNAQSWQELIHFWFAYNQHLAFLIQHTNRDTLNNTMMIDDKGPFTLSFIMSDYLEHLKHHLLQIIPDWGITTEFSMKPYE
ncbi:MAG: DinB family protein [Lewinellaceae bacterium]|nr:DinB family protein [Saprospiraceae bacterium]MCB9342253.1 DinB family protein [Lewinellaceae bacterium]